MILTNRRDLPELGGPHRHSQNCPGGLRIRSLAAVPGRVPNPEDDTTPTAAAPAAAAPSILVLPPEPWVPAPERFSGERHKFRAFCSACQLYYILLPKTFSLESNKAGLTIALLQVKPQARAHQLLEQNSPLVSFLDNFFSLSCQCCTMIPRGPSPPKSYCTHCAKAADYIVEFRRWSGDTG